MPVAIWSWAIPAQSYVYDLYMNGRRLSHISSLLLWPGPLKGIGLTIENVTDEDGNFIIDWDKGEIATRTRFGFIRIAPRYDMLYMPGAIT